ncbi:MAG: putative sporulation protein YtxC [Clostridiaceae bacterium]|nr:putative sporulation protein YtxC [Clostridiaceae bacterium]
MRVLSIGVNKCADEVFKYIENELIQLKNDKIDYSIDKIKDEGYESIICKVPESKSQARGTKQVYKTLILNVSNALADYIICCYEEKLIKRIVNSNYCYFSKVERKDILKEALNIVKNEDKSFLNTLLQIRRRNIIVKSLMEYFESSNTIILDGFINFRLKDYLKDLEEIVEKAVDNFLMEKEYREFIRLLKYFVDIQEPKYENIHIIATNHGTYTLLDDRREEITNECIKEYLNEISESEINYDDLLVSSLITLAPKKITIHNISCFKNKELLETIHNIFYNNVCICRSCSICNVNINNSCNLCRTEKLEVPKNIT